MSSIRLYNVFFICILLSILAMTGCGSESIILPSEGGSIEPGFYTGTIINTITSTTSTGVKNTTQETVPINIQINEDGSIYSGGEQVYVGMSDTINLGSDPMTATVTGISGDTDTLVINFTISGKYETATISGYMTETFQSNTQGGLNLKQYTQMLWSGNGFSIYQTSSGTAELTK